MSQEYVTLLQRYVELTKRIRSMERGIPFSEIYFIDRERHEIHTMLNMIALKLGKTENDIIGDILLQEGNLREYGIEAPIIRLALVGVYFRFDENEVMIKVSNENRSSGRGYQRISTPDGKMVAQIRRPYFMDLENARRRRVLIKDEESVEGDVSQIEKWNTGKWVAVIYSQYTYSYGILQALPLHKTRVERCKRLCGDFGLHPYDADDTMGHRDYSSVFLIGAEIPAVRLEEMAMVMRNEPEKYWLTKEELVQIKR